MEKDMKGRTRTATLTFSSWGMSATNAQVTLPMTPTASTDTPTVNPPRWHNCVPRSPSAASWCPWRNLLGSGLPLYGRLSTARTPCSWTVSSTVSRKAIHPTPAVTWTWSWQWVPLPGNNGTRFSGAREYLLPAGRVAHRHCAVSEGVVLLSGC